MSTDDSSLRLRWSEITSKHLSCVPIDLSGLIAVLHLNRECSRSARTYDHKLLVIFGPGDAIDSTVEQVAIFILDDPAVFCGAPADNLKATLVIAESDVIARVRPLDSRDIAFDGGAVEPGVLRVRQVSYHQILLRPIRNQLFIFSFFLRLDAPFDSLGSLSRGIWWQNADELKYLCVHLLRFFFK